MTKWILVAALTSLLACGSDDKASSGADAGATHPGADAAGTADPVQVFYADFHASRYSQAGADAEALDAFVAAHPGAGDASIVRGLAHLWHIAEFGRDPSQDPSGLPSEAMATLGAFQEAQAQNPDDPRVDCWLGLTLVNAGRQIGSDDLVEQGLATIDQGVEAYPEFNLFCRSLAYDSLPASDPDFARSVDALWQTVDRCFGETVDRSDPDIAPYLDQATRTGQKRVCWNDDIAPHNAEGFLLYFGDVLVKHGDVEPARVMYQNVQKIAEYSSWPYKGLVEERLGADLAARAALYQDGDSTNDPPLGGDTIAHSCTACHAASADE